MSDAPIDAAAEALARRLLTTLPARQPVARDAIDRLPSPVARLLHRQLDARVDREAALPTTPWLDREHAAVREALSSWRETARTAARVPADAWEDMLAEASRNAVAHLVQPAETLAAYAFADALASPDPLPTPLVLERLRAFEPYPYLIEIVERYIDKKGLGHIDRDGLERLLLRIDSRMVAEFSAEDWTRHLTPLFDLLEGTVPAALLELAFDARDHRQLVAHLDGDPISPDALRAHLETAPARQPTPDPTPEVITESPTNELATDPAVPDRPAAAPAFEVRPPVIGSKFNAPEDVAPDDSDVIGPARPVEIVAPMTPMTSLDTPSGTITDAVVTETLEEVSVEEDEPLWKRLGGTAETTPRTGPAAVEGTPLWAQFSDSASSTVADTPVASATVASATVASAMTAKAPSLRTDASLDTLERAVLGAADPDRRAWYTAELFSGDATAYRTTLLQLDAARTWTEATDIIARDVFREHSVNIYSDPAVTFTDAVEAAMEARTRDA